MSTIEEKEKEIIKNYVESYNKFDVEGMMKNLNPEIVFENISNGVINLRTEGIESFKKQAEKAKNYFVEREQIIESWDHTH
jgi:hypothetical protein